MMAAHGWEEDQRWTLARAAMLTGMLDLVSNA
jgi:hypothetical protein